MATMDGRRSTELYLFSLSSVLPCGQLDASFSSILGDISLWILSRSFSNTIDKALAHEDGRPERRMVEQRRNGFSNQRDFHLIRFCCRRRADHIILDAQGWAAWLHALLPKLSSQNEMGFEKLSFPWTQVAKPSAYIFLSYWISTLAPPLLWLIRRNEKSTVLSGGEWRTDGEEGELMQSGLFSATTDVSFLFRVSSSPTLANSVIARSRSRDNRFLLPPPLLFDFRQERLKFCHLCICQFINWNAIRLRLCVKLQVIFSKYITRWCRISYILNIWFNWFDLYERRSIKPTSDSVKLTHLSFQLKSNKLWLWD